MANTKWIKIAIPVLIIAMVGGIFLLKQERADETIRSEPKIIDGADFSLHVTEMLDFEALAAHKLPLIVDYGATECIPCKEMAPVLEKLNADMAGKAFIKFVDVWKHPDAAANVPVQIIPTQFFFKADGTPFIPSDELGNRLGLILYSMEEGGDPVFTAHQGGLTEEDIREILAEMGVE